MLQLHGTHLWLAHFEPFFEANRSGLFRSKNLLAPLQREK